MQDVTAGTGKGNSGHEQFNDASAGAGTKGCNSSQGNQKGNLSIPDQPPLISSANVLWCHQKQQLTLLELKAECLQHLESINVQGGELAEFVMPLRVYLADSKTSQDDATERRNLCYFLKIVKKHAITVYRVKCTYLAKIAIRNIPCKFKDTALFMDFVQ